MRITVNETQIRGIIKKILLEQESLNVKFPENQYGQIVKAFESAGLDKAHPYMMGIAAICLEKGRDNELARAIVSSHPGAFNLWNQSILIPWAKSEGKEAIDVPSVSASKDVPILPEDVEKYVKVVNEIGKPGLASEVRRQIGIWNGKKQPLQFPRPRPEEMDAVLDFVGKNKPDPELKTKTSGLPKFTTGPALEGEIANEDIPGLFSAEQLLGKKFSSVENGQPDFVIVYVGEGPFGKVIVATRYSKSKIQVLPKFGRELTASEIKSIDPDKFFDKFKESASGASAIAAIREMKKYNESDLDEFRGILFKNHYIFRPYMDLMKMPVFAATDAARIAAQEGKCTINMKEEPSIFLGQLGRYLFPTGEPLTDEEKLQTMICLKDNTVDSLGYGLAQMILALTGIGLAVEVLSDLVPGFILAEYYNRAGNQKEAQRIMLMSCLAAFLPAGLDKLLKAPFAFFIKMPLMYKIFKAVDAMYEEADMRSPGQKYYEQELERLSKESESTGKSVAELIEQELKKNEAFKKAIDEQGILTKYPDL